MFSLRNKKNIFNYPQSLTSYGALLKTIVNADMELRSDYLDVQAELSIPCSYTL